MLSSAAPLVLSHSNDALVKENGAARRENEEVLQREVLRKDVPLHLEPRPGAGLDRVERRVDCRDNSEEHCATRTRGDAHGEDGDGLQHHDDVYNDEQGGAVHGSVPTRRVVKAVVPGRG